MVLRRIQWLFHVFWKVLGPARPPPRPSLRGSSWPSWGVFAHLGAIFWPSWGRVEVVLGSTKQPIMIGCFPGGHFGVCWGHVGPFGAVSGPLWNRLGAVSDHAGAI